MFVSVVFVQWSRRCVQGHTVHSVTVFQEEKKKYSATLHLSIDSHAFIHLTFSRPGALWGPQTLFCCQSPWNTASNEIPSKTDLQHESEITPPPSQWLTAPRPPIIPLCAHQRHSQTGDCTRKILTSGIQSESVKRWELVHHHHHHHHHLHLQLQTGGDKISPVSRFWGHRDATVSLCSDGDQTTRGSICGRDPSGGRHIYSPDNEEQPTRDKRTFSETQQEARSEMTSSLIISKEAKTWISKGHWKNEWDLCRPRSTETENWKTFEKFSCLQMIQPCFNTSHLDKPSTKQEHFYTENIFTSKVTCFCSTENIHLVLEYEINTLVLFVAVMREPRPSVQCTDV